MGRFRGSPCMVRQKQLGPAEPLSLQIHANCFVGPFKIKSPCSYAKRD